MRLRPYIHVKDFDHIHKWITDERTHAFWCANLIPYPMTAETLQTVLEKEASDWGGCAYVATSDDGTALGFFVLSVNVLNNSGFLKFVIINNELRGKGYGTQMIELLQRYAFEITGVSSIQLNVFDVNTSARRCYAKNGFREDGFTENAFVFHGESWSKCHMVSSKENVEFKNNMHAKEIRFPKMILFDYGQTLVNERKFDGIKGTTEVMKYAVKNKHNYSSQDVQAAAEAINNELGRYAPAKSHLHEIEIPNCMFSPYLYESMGIELALTNKDRDQVFWDAASPGKPTEGILEFLNFLNKQGIRTGVISNITYCGEAVKDRIDSVVSVHNFEFIIATSEYMFRKPNKRIFELALEKAALNPEDVWYIGDNYECDVVGARNANIFPIWYVGAKETPYAQNEDVLTIKDWKELQEIIDVLSKL